MGMFDNPKPLRDSEYGNGRDFTLTDAKMGAPITTEFGETPPVLLKIDGDWYSVFGQGLTAQVERMESSDLPARVYLGTAKTRSGRDVKLLIPAGQKPPEQDDIPF